MYVKVHRLGLAPRRAEGNAIALHLTDFGDP